MMDLQTSRGNEYKIDWIGGPTITDGRVWMQIPSDRPLGEIICDFDGLEWMKAVNGDGEETKWDGWSVLSFAKIESKGVIQLAFSKRE